jgi:hypothetical protein
MSNWPNYLIRQDFTLHGNELAAVPLGLLDESNQRLIAAVLSEGADQADKDKWNMEEYGTEYSLNGVEVVFNDLNKVSLPTFSFFKYALGLKFPEVSTAPAGTIYMCWHEPAAKAPVVSTEEPPLDEPVPVAVEE